jgi:hypothetical protein
MKYKFIELDWLIKMRTWQVGDKVIIRDMSIEEFRKAKLPRWVAPGRIYIITRMVWDRNSLLLTEHTQYGVYHYNELLPGSLQHRVGKLISF